MDFDRSIFSFINRISRSNRFLSVIFFFFSSQTFVLLFQLRGRVSFFVLPRSSNFYVFSFVLVLISTKLLFFKNRSVKYHVPCRFLLFVSSARKKSHRGLLILFDKESSSFPSRNEIATRIKPKFYHSLVGHLRSFTHFTRS